MGRAPCCDDAGLKKGPWTPEEDEKLVDYINRNGHGSWRALPKLAGLNRCGKSCRLRWTNYLRPDIKRGRFTAEEEQQIIHLHSYMGNKWSAIASQLPGRTDNEIKNFWNTHLKKKLLQMGIDPVTHQRRVDLDLFGSLGHLLSTSNYGNVMNPFDNALRVQADLAKLAKIQLLQSLISLSNAPLNMDAIHLMSALPNLNSNELFQSNGQFDGLLEGTVGLPHEQFQLPSCFPDSNMPKLVDDYQTLVESSPCIDGSEMVGAINGSGSTLGYDNNSMNGPYPITTANPTTLVSACPDHAIVDQFQNQINPTEVSAPSSTSTSFEAWGEFNLDDKASDSFWTDMIDQESSPSWPIKS